MRRLSTFGLVFLALLLVVSSSAARDRKSPRIVAAAMQDRDGDSRADRVRLTYSERIRHAVDSDGKYPFTVAGYRIRSIGAPNGKTLVLALAERDAADHSAAPAIQYKRTTSKPVRDRARNQAAAQRFTGTKPHGNAPDEPPTVVPAPPADTTPPDTTIASGPTGTATTRGAAFTYTSADTTAAFECSLDGAAFASCPAGGQSYTGLADGSHTFQVRARDPAGNVDATPDSRGWSVDGDGDGTLAPADCAPDNPAIRPGAADPPELTFTDTNCDGIDGTAANAIFASPTGNDTNAGTKAAPVRQLSTAVTKAVAAGKQVYAAGGAYGGVATSSGVAIYGGYSPDWSRSLLMATTITSTTDGIQATGASIVLQHLTVNGGRSGTSGYGIRLVSGASATLQRVLVTAADGTTGSAGANGTFGGPGFPGGNGRNGQCDGSFQPRGGLGGASTVAGREGGEGGPGGPDSDSTAGDGWPGEIGTPGGAGGAAGNPGKPGKDGAKGADGSPGVNGSGGGNSVGAAAATWIGSNGSNGSNGTHGNGGGGGGGGGGQSCFFCADGTGNSGGGGGGGGERGNFGAGGGYGGGSFGIYVYNSTVTVSAGSAITAGKGGAGGDGGRGGAGGNGGAGGVGATYCLSEIGAGGDGGQGGYGGRAGAGGGGAGGPSIGIFKVGISTATVDSSSQVTAGGFGPGGKGGEGGLGFAPAGANGIAAAVYPP